MQASSNTYKRISANYVSCSEIKWTYYNWHSDMQSSGTLNYAMNTGPTAELHTDTTAALPVNTTRPIGDETAKSHILNE